MKLKVNLLKLKVSIVISFAYLLLFGAGCPGQLQPSTPVTDNVSMTEIAEAVVSGVVNATATNGTQARFSPPYINKNANLVAQIQSTLSLIPNADAAYSYGICPTVQYGDQTFLGVDCVAAPGPPSSVALTYPPCNLTGPYGVWSGGEQLANVPPATPMTFTCGVPPVYAAGVVISRTFSVPTGRIANPQIPNVVTSGYPVNVLVDMSQTCPLTSPRPACDGYSAHLSIMAETITYTGPVARTIQINGLHLSGLKAGYVVWDFTVDTPPGQSLQVDSSNNVTQNIGEVRVQNNMTNVTTISTITSSLSFSVGCGVATGGSMHSVVSINPAISGDGANAPSTLPETMNFTSTCGLATLNGTNYTLYHAY